MRQSIFSNLQLNQLASTNPNKPQQNSFRQSDLRARNRNRFMSSDLLVQNQENEASNKLFQEHDFSNEIQLLQAQRSNYQMLNAFERISIQVDKSNSSKTNQSSHKTSSNQKRRNHALRKQVINGSLNKFKRQQGRPFLQKLRNYKLTQNCTFNKITWEQYQSGQWMVSSQPVKTEETLSPIQPVEQCIDGLANQINSLNPQVQNSRHFVDNELKSSQKLQKNSIKSEEQQSQQEQIQQPLNDNSITIPQRKVQDFIPQIYMQNKLHRNFNVRSFESNPNQNFSTRYEIYYPRNSDDNRIYYQLTTKTLQGFKIISINCGKNLNNYNRRIQKTSYKTSQWESIKQMIEVILNYMDRGYDFILLQQACDPTFQKYLTQAIICFNKLNKEDIYFYPQNLEKDIKNLRITTILTRHQVKMGQFQFKFQQFPDNPDYNPRLPTQAFCQFRIKINDKWQNVCIFCCHLKSSQGHKIELFSQVRMQQVDSIKKFSQKYDRFFCIGDTNIPSSYVFNTQNNYVEQLFFDAINYGISEYRGTYLFKNPKGKVVEERIDRIWLNKQSALTTSVLINYHDILLESCEDLDLDQIKMLERADDVHPYITVTDHTILDIEIMFTK